MFRFVARRTFATIPTLVGISLVTFVLLNLTMGPPTVGVGPLLSAAVGQTARDREHYYGYHLPLFLNFDIDDARSFAASELDRLSDPRRAPGARRAIARVGGAWLPYIIASLDDLGPEARREALVALDAVADRIGANRELSVAPDRAAFWKRYWDIYGADFEPVRAGRLVRRYVRHDDKLALAELRRLDTFALPQLMDVLDEELDPEAQERIVDLLATLTGIDDRIDESDSAARRAAVISRWQDWWSRRYDRYTTFEGFRRLTGVVTQTRYFRWLARIATLDFGVSTRDGQPITTKLAKRLPVTAFISFLALLLAYAVAIPVGLVAAVRRGSLFDRFSTVLLFVLYSVPTFWMAMLLLRYLAGADHLDIFPAQGISSPGAANWPLWRRTVDMAHHLVLPVFCLSFVPMAMLARYQRVGMLQVIGKDYIRTARAKGLGRVQAILRHGLRNGVLPVITMIGLQIPYLVSGSVVVERIFGIPGMGLETFEAIRAHDQPWLLAVVTASALMTLVGVVLADALYALIDPRIVPGRAGGGGAR